MYLVGYLVAQHDGGLVGPAARDVADGVAAAAQHERGQVIREHVPHALRVATHTKVEAAESVAAQAVGPTLEHEGAGLVRLHDLLHHRHEDPLVRLVGDAVAQRHVDRVVLALRR